MKKVNLITIFLVIVAILFSGCDSNSNQNENFALNNENNANLDENSIDNRSLLTKSINIDDFNDDKNYFNFEDNFEKYNFFENYDKIDCSNENNFNIENISFHIMYKCTNGSSINLMNTCDRKKFYVEPVIAKETFPSLNEYYFNYLSVVLKNTGCTKLNLNDYNIYYGLYDNKMLDKAVFDINKSSFHTELYPNKINTFNLGFGSQQMLPEGKLVNKNETLNFKVCLVNKKNISKVICDKEKFSIN